MRKVKYQTRERVFHQEIQTPKSGGKNEAQPSVFFNRLRGVWIRDETLFEFFIWPFKPFIILGDIQSKSSQNFMLIKIRYPNQ